MAVDVLCSFPSCVQHNIYRRIHAVICCYSLEILMLSAVQPEIAVSLRDEMRFLCTTIPTQLIYCKNAALETNFIIISFIIRQVRNILSFPTVLVQPFVWSQPCYEMLSYHTDDVEGILWGAWEHTEDSVSCLVHPAINSINSSREFYLLYGLRSLQNMTHPSWQNSRVPSRNLETKWKLVLIFSDTILPSSGRVL